MTLATGVGSMPFDSEQPTNSQYAEATRIILDTLPELAHVPELPGRGVAAGMIGRGLAVIAGLGVDLQPAGWRLTDASGVDHRRARSLLAQDLDTVEELSQGYAGVFKTQIAGPWTLAATVEKPRGDKVLSDHGARRDLAQALAEGVRSHLADVRGRVGGATTLLVQIDEPALPAVMAGRVPTASGFGRHRTVHPPEASEALQWLTAAVVEAGGVPIVHCCAPEFPISLVRGAGAQGVSVDLGVLDAAGHDQLAEAVDAGDWVLLGAVAAVAGEPAPSDSSVTERVTRLLDMLGLEPSERLVVTPSCGLAGATPAWSREALRLAAAAASHL
ncbi:putative cobalamin-independent methionine synthase [metagenome]|uniref:Putative cobalamin-independent methionine synthase n=1 Tax=metagenome TaxID=256318 RepID=A0A2P2C350_9ZZZZ